MPNRWAQVYKAIGMAGLGRVIGLVSNILQVPIALHYLGSDVFGLWMAVTNALLIFGVTDLGLGLGLQNSVSHSFGERKFHQANKQFCSAVAMLIVVSSVLLIIYLYGVQKSDLTRLFKVSSLSTAYLLEPALRLQVVLFCVNLPLVCVQRFASGIQMGWMVSAVSTFSAAATLFGIYFGSVLQIQPPLFMAIPMIVQSAANVVLFFWLRKKIRWFCRGLISVDVFAAWNILKRGILFLVPQLSSAVLASAAPLSIASQVGTNDLAVYTLLARIASIPNQLVSMLTVPLWPAYAEAFARNDVEWINKAFKISFRVALTAAGLSLLTFVFAGNTLISFWVGSSVGRADLTTLMAFGLYSATICITPGLASLLNGLDVLGMQAVLGVVASVGMTALTILMCAKWGIVGAAAAQTIVYGCVNLPFSLYLCKKTLAQLNVPITTQR